MDILRINSSDNNKYSKLLNFRLKSLDCIQLLKDCHVSAIQAMADTIVKKCNEDNTYKELLEETGNALIIEDTTDRHDNLWGVCYCDRCKDLVAKNYTGIALMRARAALKNKQAIVSTNIDGNVFTYNFNCCVDNNGVFEYKECEFALNKIYRSTEAHRD